MLAISRSDDELNTWGQRSDDMGMTWGPLISYTSQVGALDLPQLIRVNGALILLGREALSIPGLPPNTAPPRQLVAFVSYDDGKTFGYGTVINTYTGLTIDGGYCWPLRMDDGRLFVVYYADSHGLRQPDIKSRELRVVEPRRHEVNALHVVTQLASAQATHRLNLNLSRYSLDFRFHSRPTPAGSQFTVSLGAPQMDGTADLVRWELPSTHATDPAADSGFIANGQFVQAMNSFAYGDSYRVRTTVDETLGVQIPEVLDLFGQVVNPLPAQPFANEAAAHPSMLAIGNSSTLRATDTLLDFVFVRPAAEIEPEVTIMRIH